ncbi:MAG TPA: NCS2 family permease [Candidatus Nanoperiomorbaceae bacterium]|nr:NCS2 family permease [Candidatus Nanoperiomorbaceae bacterium]HMQ96858.1 NCS2 family permease [Candidatus Nanoperiomorbaceae bacterium]
MSAAKTKELSPIDAFFEITARGSNIGREVRGGLVTFFTMAYILALNPLIIGTATDVNGLLLSGLPKLDAAGQVIGANVATSIAMVAAATALIAGLMTILMGVYGRFPIGLATGLGLNAILAYVLAPQMTWAQAMGLVVWEGVIITILVLTGFRRAVFRAVPRSLRAGISVGIGLFIAFIGLVDAGVVRKAVGTPVELGIGGSLQGWPIGIFLITLGLLVLLFVRRVKGAILIAILSGTVLSVIIEAVAHIGAHDATDNPAGWMLNVPQFTAFAAPDLGLIGRVDLFGGFNSAGAGLGLVLIVFSLLLADFFDTMGTIVAVGAEGDLLDESGNPPRTQEILLVDSIAAIAGGVGSVSSNTSYIESAAGVGEGARTGLASVVTGAAFLVSLFLAPLVNMVPSEAAAPALFFVGFLMMSQISQVEWDDPEEGIPAFLTLALMPFTYSITTGIGAGFISYALIKLVRGKARQVHPLMWVVAALFIVYFAQGAISSLLA